MIRRKDTLGYIDFMRGKYSLYNKYYIINMLKQMTIQEKESLRTNSFDILWKELWGQSVIHNKYKNEENISREKFNQLSSGIYLSSTICEGTNSFYKPSVKIQEPPSFDMDISSISIQEQIQSRWINNKETNSNFYSLNMLIDESLIYDQWEEQEWGFPKGRRNYQEKEHDCAMREFSEETGYNCSLLKNIDNVLPFEEIFMGSNYKSYKHKYFLMYMDYEDSLHMNSFEKSEVSKIEWKTYEESIESIRKYNLERKKIISNINKGLTKYKVCRFLDI